MSIKFTKEDLQKAIDTDNAHRYRGVTCGLVNLDELRKVQRYAEWDLSLPTYKPMFWKATGAPERLWNDPAWNVPVLVKTAHGVAGERLLKHLHMENGRGVVLAGGKITLAMQCNVPVKKCVAYGAFKQSDFDLFIVGMSEADAEEKIVEILEDMKDCDLDFDDVVAYRNQNCVTIVCSIDGTQMMTIQIILRLYSSISEIIHGFDIGAAQVAFDGKEVWLTSLGRVAFEQGIIVLNLSRRRGTYETRLTKYFKRGFAIVLPNLDVRKLTPQEGCQLPFIELHPSTVKNNEIEGYILEEYNSYSDYGGCDYLPKEVALANYRKLMRTTDERLKNLFLFYKVGENLVDIEAAIPSIEELRDYYRRSVISKLDAGEMSPKHLSRHMPDAIFKDHARNLMGRFLTGYGPTPAEYWDSMQLTDQLLKFVEKRKAAHFELQDNLKPQWKSVEEGTTLKDDQKMINPFKMEEVSVDEWYGDYFAENA